ncbi:cyanoexosortase B [Roseofilum casamattae]|uniref:Cyanoexosortase B n=1 Tax=Roseofilum casamattae BLCC-M143 TaxID=3022442 RepID=A0ABT7BYX0_9CYAN|nr:cyanoexosortase B [Roseofilum casamattae]MDJ1184393.1 cyanoexosortase B [Roseofilum casamattae BLCC-M143]
MTQQSPFPNAIPRSWLNYTLIALPLLIYGPLLIHWCDGWLNKSISIEHEYFSHGLIGLPFAAYIFWTKREQWMKLRDRSAPLGGVLLGLGGVAYATGLPDLVNLSFPLILTGMCLWLKGIPGLKLQWFPLLLVALATPTEVPYLIEPYILPLQSFISSTAGFILSGIVGMDVTVNGIYLSTGGRLVEVAPHCAGLKMLFTSLYVALMLLYWTGAIESRRKVILLLVGSVGISVLANIIRNSLLTYFHGTGNDALFHWLHESWGGDLYSAGMLGIVVLLLNWIDTDDYLEDTDETFESSDSD